MTDDLDEWAVGPVMEIGGRRMASAARRFDSLTDAATAAQHHLWIAVLGYLVSVPLRSGALLDPDAICGPPVIHCYVCERVYLPGMEDTACLGVPA